MSKVRILVVSPPALSHLIAILFRDRADFEVVGTLNGLKSLSHRAGRLSPELIVALVKPVQTGVCPAVVAIKRFSPMSKVILICPISDLIQGACECGADACLDQEKLVSQLLPTASALSAHSKLRSIR